MALGGSSDPCFSLRNQDYPDLGCVVYGEEVESSIDIGNDSFDSGHQVDNFRIICKKQKDLLRTLSSPTQMPVNATLSYNHMLLARLSQES